MEPVRRKEKRPGRPEKAVKKEVRAAVRFTGEEYQTLQDRAKQAGIKVSAFIREAVFKTKIVARLSEEERGFIRELVGMSQHLNQVARLCHRENLPQTAEYFERYRGRLDAVLLKLRP